MFKAKLLLILVLALVSTFFVGCGQTRIHETHLLQARDAQNNIAYYRVNIKGSANLAKSDYRAGFYDAEALDAVMGEISEQAQPLDANFNRKRQEAVAKLQHDYYQALQDPNTNDEELKGYQRRFARALMAPYEIVEESGIEMSRPREKWAVIFSADATAVEEAMAEFVEGRDSVETVYAAVAALRRDAFIDVAATKNQQESSVLGIAAIKEQVEGLIEDPSNPTLPERNEQIRRLLVRLSQMETD